MAVNVSAHITNSDIHITAEERTAWNNKADASKAISATLLVSAWTGTAEPYTQTLALSDVTASCNGIMCLGQNTTKEQRDVSRTALLSILSQDEGSITIVADGDKPTIDIPITIILIN